MLAPSAQKPVRVLIVDDDEDDARAARALLSSVRGVRFEPEWHQTYEEGLAALLTGRHDVCLVDYRIGRRTGVELLREAAAAGNQVPVILMTGSGNRHVDVAAEHAGAMDYLPKGSIDAAALERSIRYALARKRDERELRRSNEQKNELLGMTVHDLRTPLGVILGYAEMLIADGDGATLAERARVLERIRVSSHFMRAMIDDLLDLSSIEAGTLELDLVRVPACDVVRSSVESAALLGEKKSITVRVDTPAATDEVLVDPRRFDQVLANVLGNALKYSAEVTMVRVTVERVGDEVVFSVIDQGIGVEPALAARLFEPFVHGGSGTAGEKSTGLGLAIARRIVAAHRGRIWVESEGGRGSTFRVALPVAREDAATR